MKKHAYYYPTAQGLYDPAFEHDACGVGFVASIHGRRSNEILKKALGCVCNLQHRGAVDADAQSGDGAGVLTQIPIELFRKEIESMGHKLFDDSDLAVGMFFLPREDAYAQAHCRKVAEEVVKSRGLMPLDWRTVPVHPDVLGDKAAAHAPLIEQLFVVRPSADELDDERFESVLYLCRREIEKNVAEKEIDDFYVCSLSSKTIIYKGMFTAPQLERFYTDLHSPDYFTSLALFHQRYSTNTFPTWALAQPFRMLAHNGEINTIRGNRNWLRAREADFQSDRWADDIGLLKGTIQACGSDSASLDNGLELVTQSGRSILHALMMMVPAAYRSELNKTSPEVRGFYEFHELIAEPWDGPAALAVSDGRWVAACLDRNGLRPARYKITSDGVLLMSSEVGVGQFPDDIVIEKGRLAPGEMIAIDTENGELLRNEEIKSRIASSRPYNQWVADNLTTLDNADHLKQLKATALDEEAYLGTSGTFGYNDEEWQTIILPMLQTGQEPLGSMGDDTPLAVLSQRPRLLCHYFRQIFAQVTNPPIDPIREKLVMNVNAYLGRKPNWLDESAEHAKQLWLNSPVLTNTRLDVIRSLDKDHLRSVTISCTFPAAEGPTGLKNRLQALCHEAKQAIEDGAALVILSDRGADRSAAAVPMLLATAALHHELIRSGMRMRCSIVCETGECRDVHQFACLIGYGASAINPYLVWDAIAFQLENPKSKLGDASEQELIENYVQAVDKGILKIMSKMGISKLSSYHGAQIFEAIGLGNEFVNQYFTATPSFIGGVGLGEVARETMERHRIAWEEASAGKPAPTGFYRFRRDGERHAVTPNVLQTLHKFVGIKGEDQAGAIDDYREFVTAVEGNRPISLRDLMRFKPQNPIPIDEVEPEEEILRRFTTAGMSFGALSPEAHEGLAMAMNRIGGKSNSGEGGEDRARFTPDENGDSRNSKIKQVASGRFGVTAEYLASASEIEIKIAQGAKPGEGGQIPGHKVSALIARLRHSTPGIMLISPPPHHDIYSIEDLAQLIYDLKQVNPRAKVCVKLVAEAGVGTIAAGVAKAHADIILISGFDGGTGASPLSSIKFAGSPWESGLAETQQVLLLNKLRNRVTLRTDGGLRTGRDIVIAAILGAEEYNFGTAAMLALGCVYVRQCHLNTCPVGIATQDEKLRGKYKGTPDGVVRYLRAVAAEARQILADIGVHSLDELIGHTEYLEQISIPDHPKANTLDLSAIFHVPDIDDLTPRIHTWERNDKHEDQPLDQKILQDVKSTLQTRKPIQLEYKIRNIHRCIGTQLSGEIAYRFGDEGLPDNTIQLNLKGSAGQSLGVFLVRGVHIHLTGEANDYVGKGMNGGEIVLVPPAQAPYDPSENIICGNTCLYGATGGRLYAYGRAGERFAVRNSGAVAVVEGIGDHGCEYMTNGCVVILGPTGKNFGAGMSGGSAYILDADKRFKGLLNPDMVEARRIEDPADAATLQTLIEDYARKTGSSHARRILDEWSASIERFWKVAPASTTAPVTADAAK